MNMFRNALLIFSAILAFAASAADVDGAAKKARRKNRVPSDMWIYGGYVTKPNSARGKVVFLNAQKLLPAVDFQKTLDYIRETLHPEMSLVDVDTVKLLNPKDDIVKAGGKVGVVLADSPDLPMMVTAPEAGWAIVNVAALKDGDKDGTKLAHRVRVELLRAFALASGCAYMTRDPVALRSFVLIPEDLDVIKSEELGVLARMQIAQELPTHGVTPWKVTTYLEACREGWAHSPTNKCEQKIWDKVHAAPEKPLKITYDKAAQKPVVK